MSGKDLKTIYFSELGRVLSRGALLGFAITASAAALGFFVSIVLARLLGAEHFGVYILVACWLQLLHMAGRLGLDAAVVRYGATYIAGKQWSALAGLIRYADRIVFRFSTLLSLIVLLSVLMIGESLSYELRMSFLLGSIVLPVWGVIRIRESGLRAGRLIGRSQLGEAIVRPLLFCLLSLLWYFYASTPYTAPVAMGLGVVNSLMLLGLVAKWFACAFPEIASAEVEDSPEQRREWIRFGIPVAATAGMVMLIRYTDVIMIGALVGSEESGLYSVASQFADLSMFGLSAVNLILAPLIAELTAGGKTRELQRILTLGASGSFVFALVVTLVLWVFGGLLLGLYGEAFLQGSGVMRVLLLGQLVNVGAGSVGNLMVMSGNQSMAFRVVALTATLNIVLNAVCIPFLGALGAAIATAVSTSFWNIVLFREVRARLQVDSSVFSIFGTGVASDE